jgi:hypothetical protein
MSRHVLFLGKILCLLFPPFFPFFLSCIRYVVGDQARACAFEKITFTPRTMRYSNVKRALLSVCKLRDDFFR